MSVNLYYRRVPKNIPPEKTLEDKLKYILGHEFWGHDGTLRSDHKLLTVNELSFLRGLLAAGVKDAGKLIEEIERNDAVEVWIDE